MFVVIDLHLLGIISVDLVGVQSIMGYVRVSHHGNAIQNTIKRGNENMLVVSIHD